MDQNIILLAQNFNPTIFSDSWLKSYEILGKDEVVKQQIYTPIAVNLTTESFSLVITPEQLQLTIQENAPAIETIQRTTAKIIRLLPHTPLAALGINFDWFAEPEDAKRYYELSREFCVPQNNPILKFFGKIDSRFGIYMSADHGDFRLKLDIKPRIYVHEKEKIEGLNFSFNFHRDLKPNVAKQTSSDLVLPLLDQWKALKEKSEEIMTEATSKWK